MMEVAQSLKCPKTTQTNEVPLEIIGDGTKELDNEAISSSSDKSDSAISSTSSFCSNNSSPSSLIADDEQHGSVSASSGNTIDVTEVLSKDQTENENPASADSDISEANDQSTEATINAISDQVKLDDKSNCSNRPQQSQPTIDRCHTRACPNVGTQRWPASCTYPARHLNNNDPSRNFTFRHQLIQHEQFANHQQFSIDSQQPTIYAAPVDFPNLLPYQSFCNPMSSHYVQAYHPQTAIYTTLPPAHLIQHHLLAPVSDCYDHINRNQPYLSPSHDLPQFNCPTYQQFGPVELIQPRAIPNYSPAQYVAEAQKGERDGYRLDSGAGNICNKGKSAIDTADEIHAQEGEPLCEEEICSCCCDSSKTLSSSPNSRPNSPVISSDVCCRSSDCDNQERADSRVVDPYQHLSTAQTTMNLKSSRNEVDGYDDKEEEEQQEEEYNERDNEEWESPVEGNDRYSHQDPSTLSETSTSNEDSSYPHSSLDSPTSTTSSLPSFVSSTKTSPSIAPSCPSSRSSPCSRICPSDPSTLMSHENDASDKIGTNNSIKAQSKSSRKIENFDSLSVGNCGRYIAPTSTSVAPTCQGVTDGQVPAPNNQHAYLESTSIGQTLNPVRQQGALSHHVAAYAIASGQRYMSPVAPYENHHPNLSTVTQLTAQHQPVAPLLLIPSPPSSLPLPMAVVPRPPVATPYYTHPVFGTQYQYPEQIVYSYPTTIRSQQLGVMSQQAGPSIPHQHAHYQHEPAMPYYITSTGTVSPTRSHLHAYLNPTMGSFHQDGVSHVHHQQSHAFGSFPVSLCDTGRQQASVSISDDRHQQMVSPMDAFSQLRNGYNLISSLPIDAQPACTRQAYGMDKVWRDEFEQLFSQLISSIVWSLIEVESNPSLRNCNSIIDYRGRYIVECDIQELDGGSAATSSASTISSVQVEENILEPVESSNADQDSNTNGATEEDDDIQRTKEKLDKQVSSGTEIESDCDSGAQMNSTSSNSETGHECSSSNLGSDCVDDGKIMTGLAGLGNNKIPTVADQNDKNRNFPTRFRMFIDSAKVRFCCDNCGHGWTSMKGRVVFWYELFELVDSKETSSNSNSLIGYVAYKLFGQQCDICKIENRFERPMWYPEEVTKVLNNLYNKIGQVYFGFKMPAIDKQRRAGKPKTSHNSSLCQACHDGVCTDRK